MISSRFALRGHLQLLLLLLSLCITATTQLALAETMRIAVLDQSATPVEGLSAVQHDAIVDALRGQAGSILGQEAQVLTSANTLEILRESGIDPGCVDDQCKLSMARSLQADWMMITKIIPTGGQGFLIQMSLYETAKGSMPGFRQCTAEGWLELMECSKEGCAELFVLALPEGLNLGGTSSSGSAAAADWDFDTSTDYVVQFASTPVGATLYLNGSYVGETPCSRQLPEGPIRVKLSLARYEDFSTSENIAANRELAYTLTPTFGYLTVSSTPANQPVTIDGEAKGRTPLRDTVLGFGSHQVEVGDVSQVYAESRSVQVLRGEHGTAEFTLAIREGGLSVSAHDSQGNAQVLPVSVDGKSVGQTPHRMKLIVGSHKLKVGAREEQVVIREREVTEINWEVQPIVTQSRGSQIVGGSSTSLHGPLAGMTFVSIPAGSYRMGSPDSEHGRDGDEGPVHTVTLDAFQIMSTEVTQAMWSELMGTNPSKFKGDNLPVESVSWNDAQDFIRKLNQRDANWNYRLPTEAEWEYACRAGSQSAYHFGNSASQLGQYAWYSGNSDNNTHPVGQKQPSDWGLYDMHGNVWEWCSDWYAQYGSGSVSNPTGPQSGSSRVFRGGSGTSFASLLRCAYRGNFAPSDTFLNLGFRLVRTATP